MQNITSENWKDIAHKKVSKFTIYKTMTLLVGNFNVLGYTLELM